MRSQAAVSAVYERWYCVTYERYYGKLRTDLEATCLDGKVLVVPLFGASSSGGKTQDHFHLTACEVLISSLIDKTGQSLFGQGTVHVSAVFGDVQPACETGELQYSSWQYCCVPSSLVSLDLTCSHTY